MPASPGILVVLFALTTAGCQPNSAGVEPRPEPVRACRSAASESDVIPSSELASLSQSGNLLEFLRRARPAFLTGRGRLPQVSIDGSAPTSLAALSTVGVADVREVRMLRTTTNSAMASILADGRVAVTDIILVTTGARR